MTPAGGAERFFVETWGCQMNELDSRRLAGQLVAQGMVPTSDPAAADWILLNSCSVREKAEQKVYSRLGEYRQLKAERPSLRLALCGCVGQQEGERALARVAELDLVLGPARVGELGRLVHEVRRGERIVAVGFPEEREYDFDVLSPDDSPKGMVTIIEGCDKRCTFCIVPTTRGPERCRPLADVVAEARHLLALGFEEIELLGQTVNHWREPRRADGSGGENDLDFADLLDAVAPLPGLRRLRFVTSYPRDFTQRMIDCLARHQNLTDYLHLPVQSGSDRVLRRMGRGYDVASYLDLIARIRKARPAVALSTDLIVGFPGETDEEFAATLELLEAVRFTALFPFRYSPRPGTAALRLADVPVPDAVADDRLRRLNDLQNVIQAELNAELVGATKEVIVTGHGKRPGRLQGRTSCHRIVHFDGGATPPRVGEFVECRIVRAMAHSLAGELVARTAPARSTTAGERAARGTLLPVVA